MDGQTVKPTSDWKNYITSYAIQTTIYAILVIGIVLIVSNVFLPAIGNGTQSPFIRFAMAAVAVVLASPFLWALTLRRIAPAAAKNLWRNRSYRGPMIVLQVFRFVIAFVIMGFLVNNIVSTVWAFVLFVLSLIVLVLNYKKLQSINYLIEKRFITNLNEKEQLDKKVSGSHLTPWDAHITSFSVSPDFRGVGLTLMELKLREEYGVNVAMIKRGAFTIQAPDRQERIYPEDTLYVIGTDDQVVAFKKYLDFCSPTRSRNILPEDELTLQRIEVKPDSVLAGKTIKETSIRQRTKGLVVGIERNGERILNPESNAMIQAGDLLWIVGNTRRIMVLEKMIVKSTITNDNNLQLVSQQ